MRLKITNLVYVILNFLLEFFKAFLNQFWVIYDLFSFSGHIVNPPKRRKITNFVVIPPD